MELRVTLHFQDLTARPVQDFAVSFDDQKRRDDWRLKFDGLIERLNDDLELGWMTCISADYQNLDSYSGAQSYLELTPHKAAELTKELYLKAKELGKER